MKRGYCKVKIFDFLVKELIRNNNEVGFYK